MQPENGRDDAPIADRTLIAFFCVVAGAIAMGISPIFVRLADVGPFASAFWRVALALPFLWVWAAYDQRGAAKPIESPIAWNRTTTLIVLSGALFAGDLFFWHLSIVNTTVANATFLAALAPVAVVFGSWWFLKEAIDTRIVAGLLLGLTGAGCLLGFSYNFAPENLVGDGYGLITACFFGAYILSVRPARRRMPAGVLIFRSSVVTAAILFIIAIVAEPRLLPETRTGLVMLACLALVSHAGGQGLLAYALGHLPAAFSSIVIFLEGVAAALFGWLILDESLSLLQLAGSVAIFIGIFVARPRLAPASPQSAITASARPQGHDDPD